MNNFFGVYKGICTNNVDPENLNRIRAIVPQVYGTDKTETGWALPCLPVQNPATATSFTLFSVPVTGQGVWIMFEGGDVNYPVWLGTWNYQSVRVPS
jgi:hypothetical protein